MNTNTKLHAGLLGFAFTAALSLTTSTAWAAGSYKFEAVSAPTRNAFTVRLVDEATGQPVADAHVYVIRRQWLPMKGVAMFTDQRIELRPVGNGTFAYQGQTLSAGTVRLTADIGGAEVQGSIRLNG